MSGNDNNPIARGEHVIAMLSEYIDGALETAERDRVRAHLEGCDTCRVEYVELTATRAMLRAVPAVQAPRSFTLTPEMARKARRRSLFDRIFVPANAPSLAMGSVLTFVVLFFVVAGTMFRSDSMVYYTIGSGLSDDGYSQYAPKEQESAVTMGAQAAPTATSGDAAAGSEPYVRGHATQGTPEVEGVLPQGTPVPGVVPPDAGGGLTDTDGNTAESVPAPGSETPITAAEAPDDAMRQIQLVPSEESGGQANFSGSPPVDWGATVMSAVPMFLLAMGLVLAAMAWIARRNRPA